MRALRPLIPRCLDSQKQPSVPNSLLTIDESNGDIHGQRSTSRDLDRSETRIQHLPMGDIGWHTKIVLTVDMYGAGGPPSACDDNQFPHPGNALEELTDRHLAARRIGARIAISFKHIISSGNSLTRARTRHCIRVVKRPTGNLSCPVYYKHPHRIRIPLNTCSKRLVRTPPTVA